MALTRIADTWFHRRSIGDDITLLWEPEVAALLRCNIWHIRGRDRDFLIDTGLGVASLKQAAADLVQKSVWAIATHAHMDHMGGMHEFEHRLVHEHEAELMASGRSGLPLDFSSYDAASREMIASWGYDVSGGLLTALPHADFDPKRHRMQGVPATRVLREGDVLDTGDRAFEVLHLPGHSPGSIGLWEARTGTLFSGDAIYDGPLLDDIDGANIEDYLQTMRRLRELPVNVVHGGHDPSFGRERLREIADAYLAKRG